MADHAPIIQALGALGAVLLLAWGAGQLARRRGLARPGGARLAVVTACAVDSRRRLVVIRCDGREALLLTGPQGDAMLGWLGQEPGE
jgi:flagellar protein FliO/FliZ